MSDAWAARIDRDHAAGLGILRLIDGIHLCEVDRSIWIRGDQFDTQIDRALRTLAPAAQYQVLGGGELLPRGCRVPKGHLPQGAWTPLQQWLAPEVQAAALPGQLRRRVLPKLVNGGTPQPANVLVTDWESWAQYANSAPAIRLAQLRFAADDSRVAIRGTPLPPIPGQRFVQQCGVAVPCGYRWQPAIDPEILQELLGIGQDDLAIVSADGIHERIGSESFVPASRSAVRLSRKGLDHAKP